MSTFLSYCCCGQNRTFGVLFIYCLFVCLFSGEWLLDEEQLNFEDQDFDFPLSEDRGKCPLIILTLSLSIYS